MYPRNAASPPRIDIGAVVQISDGALQTTDCSVTVTPEGGNEGAGGGTLACLGTSGIWTYVPTQAETNYTAFIVAVYKTGCYPISKTVITSASATPGTVQFASGYLAPTGFLTAAAFASGALNGKGDWNTTTPPTVEDFEATLASHVYYCLVGAA